MKLELLEKAWCINWSKIDEGLYHSGNISPVYAETRGKAKSLFLSEISDYKLYDTGEDVEYTTIPLNRFKDGDKFLFQGLSLTRRQIDEFCFEQKRKDKLNTILNNELITHCYIKKGSYYRPNSCGYTDQQHRAGIYTKKEAVSHAISCSDLSIIPVDVESHNKMINEEIEDLKTRLI